MAGNILSKALTGQRRISYGICRLADRQEPLFSDSVSTVNWGTHFALPPIPFVYIVIVLFPGGLPVRNAQTVDRRDR